MTDEEVRLVLASPSIQTRKYADRVVEKFPGVFTITPLRNGDVLLGLTERGCALQIELERRK